MAKILYFYNRFTFGEISPLLNARTDLPRYQAGAALMENFLPLVQGPVKRRGGTKFVAPVKYPNRKTWLLRFEFSETTAYIIEVGHYYMRFYFRRGQVMFNNVPYEISTPYSEEQLINEAGSFNLQYVQSGDVLYLANPHHPPMKLMRMGHTDWRLVPLGGFESAINSTTVTTYVEELTPVDLFVVRDMVVNHFRVQLTPPGGAVKFNPQSYPQLFPDKYIWSNDVGWYIPNTIYTNFDNIIPNLFFSKGLGHYVERHYRAVTSQVPLEPRHRANPSAVCFFRERLCFAAGQTIWMSAAGAFEEFTPEATPQPDDPVEVTIYSAATNKIEWMTVSGGLIVGTSGGEFSVKEVTTSEPFGPANVKITQESGYGSRGGIQPLIIGSSLVFVQRGGRKVREFQYDIYGEQYKAIDLTVTAEHITTSGVLGLAWQQEPDSILWLVKNDGQLVGLTLNKAEEMLAWHRHKIGGGGKVDAVATIPAVSGRTDDLWLIVTRERQTAGGQTEPLKYIEILTPGQDYNDQITDSFYVDSGLSYYGPPVSTLSGIDHLEGYEVYILADGCTVPPQTVTGGRITLDVPATVVHVGLEYFSVLKTLNFELMLQDGTAQKRKKRIISAALRLIESKGGLLGPSVDDVTRIHWRRSPNKMDEPTPLYSGDTEFINWPGGYETDGRICVMAENPLPLTVAGIIAEIRIDGE